MTPLPNLGTLLLVAAILAVVVLVLRVLQRNQPPIQYPVLKGQNPRSNPDGLTISKGICPVCGCDEYYHGLGAQALEILYCAGEDCRQGFRVFNYGGGQVWADRVECGPDHLYRTRRRNIKGGDQKRNLGHKDQT